MTLLNSLMGLVLSALLLGGCDQKMQQVNPDKANKPALLKTQLDTLDKAKQLDAKAESDAGLQQETIDKAIEK